VTDPVLASSVQRASKVLSFTPLVPDVTKRVLGLDAKTVAQIRQNLDPEPGEPSGFLADMHDMVYTYLGPGELLNDFSYNAAIALHQQLKACGEAIQANPASGEVDLLAWLQHHVTIGTAQFLYGPRNPIAENPKLEHAFWDFDRGLGPLLVDFFPSITARKPYRGREAVVKAFVEYLDAGHHNTGGSKFVQRRIDIANQYGWQHEMTARSELSFLFAGITNTAITTFWAVLYIFARAHLLTAVREELRTVTFMSQAGHLDLSIDRLRNSTPVLMAIIRECMRLNSDNFSTRLVKTDTMLADKYHLSANSVVQIAGGVIHADASIWGPDAHIFNHERFLKIEAKENTVHPAAFRAFGGGKTLCPGRHFAMSEIVVFVGMVVLMFDIKGVNGEIEVRVKEDRVLPVHILEPRGGSPKVTVSLRDVGEIRVVK
jgi:cytochrome P450